MVTCSFEKETDALEEMLQKASPKMMTEKESEALLKKKKGAFLFRKDNAGKLFLSGVDLKGEVHHALIEQKNSQWFGMNCGTYQAKHLEQLVCLHLGCTKKETSYCSTDGK